MDILEVLSGYKDGERNYDTELECAESHGHPESEQCSRASKMSSQEREKDSDLASPFPGIRKETGFPRRSQVRNALGNVPMHIPW